MREGIATEVIKSCKALLREYPDSPFLKSVMAEINTLPDNVLLERFKQLNYIMRGDKKIQSGKIAMLEQELQVAQTDVLTELSDKRAFNNLSDEDLLGKSALLLMDLDGLKAVNELAHDKHIAGDLYIELVGKVINHHTRGTSTHFSRKHNIDTSGNGYRYGGDELVVLFDDCNKEDALKVGARIDKIFKSKWDECHAARQGISAKYIGASYGAASVPDGHEQQIDGYSLRQLLILEAEQGLSQMKEQKTLALCRELGIAVDRGKGVPSSRDIIMEAIKQQQAQQKKKTVLLRRKGDKEDFIDEAINI